MSEFMGAEHYGAERRESREEKAGRIIGEELRRLKWKEAELDSRPKGDPGKIRIAARLRRETTATFGWIADRLRMGSRSHAQNLVYAFRKKP